MENIQGIEPLIRELLPKYREHVRRVRRFGIGVEGRHAHDQREKRDTETSSIEVGRGAYRHTKPKKTQVLVGTYPPVQKIAEEFKHTLLELRDRHGVEFRPLISQLNTGTLDSQNWPHYDVFLNDLEVAMGSPHKNEAGETRPYHATALVTILYDCPDESNNDFYSPSTQVELVLRTAMVPTSKGNRRVGVYRAIHPDGKKKGCIWHLMFEKEAHFEFGDREAFSFVADRELMQGYRFVDWRELGLPWDAVQQTHHVYSDGSVRISTTSWGAKYVAAPIRLNMNSLPKGALTSFLEMMK